MGNIEEDSMTKLRNVAILVFDDVEILDFSGPYEVFNDASELTHPTAFNVYNVGISNMPMIGRGKFTVIPRYSIENCPQADILIIPGGFGTRPLLKHEKLIAWIKDQSQKVELLMSVCTGALLLAQAGLLKNCPATTHHGAFEHLQQISPSTQVIKDQRFVQASDRIFTSGGISAGIDLSLFLVEKLINAEMRTEIVKEMEYQGYDDNSLHLKFE
jgi:transcriptional regulator GlxA family with amidase domain